MSLKEGSVVIVAGKLDSRVRDADPKNSIGTIWFATQTEVAVLLANGDLWHGPKRSVFEADLEMVGVEGLEPSKP